MAGNNDNTEDLDAFVLDALFLTSLFLAVLLMEKNEYFLFASFASPVKT